MKLIKTIRWPTIEDPRFILLGYFVVVVSYALLTPAFARRPEQYIAVISMGLFLEIFLNWVRFSTLEFPLSALIACTGSFILTDSQYIWPFALAGAITVLSKHLLVFRGKHIFNPNVFTLVLLLYALPEEVGVPMLRWGGHLYWTISIFIAGAFLAYKVNRFMITVSYILTFIFGAFVRSILSGTDSFLILLSQIVGPGMQLYLFVNLTDPGTTSSDRRRQILTGVVVAVIDNIFRFQQNKNAPYLALTISLLFINIWRAYNPEKKQVSAWKVKSILINKEHQINENLQTK